MEYASAVSCRNIVDTLDGELVVGDPNAVFSEGEVGVGAADPVTMANNVKEHSLVIFDLSSDMAPFIQCNCIYTVLIISDSEFPEIRKCITGI